MPDVGFKRRPGVIAEYVERHSPTNRWPEVTEGINQMGVWEMEIYLTDSRLFMIVETPVDFDWDTAFERLLTLPRQAE